MNASYVPVQWNRHKAVYDAVLWGAIAIFIAAFVVVGSLRHSGEGAISPPILLMRALAVTAFLLLSITLCVGPLARLSTRFAPVLYNRRHLGVSTFLVALSHAGLATAYYGGFGVHDPVTAMLAYAVESGSLLDVPFEFWGFLALLILLLLASTSHDFWLANLSPRVWKGIHMLAYVAYALVVAHVALGLIRSEASAVYPVLVGVCAALVASLHVAAGAAQWRRDRMTVGGDGGWLDAGALETIPMDRARIVHPAAGPAIAVFRHEGGVSALSNVCAHQGGPLGEGRVIDGCATCPWHGHQFRVESGRAPPPYDDRVPVYETRIENGRVLVSARPKREEREA